MLEGLLTSFALLSLAAWGFLLLFRGGFWRVRERLDGPPEPLPGHLEAWPAVTALVPARNEAAVIGDAVAGLMAQDYPGLFRVIVIDDHSEDGTAAIATNAAAHTPRHTVNVITARPLEPGWTGKVWALSEGMAAAGAAFPDSQYMWLTDADIWHDPSNLRRLVARAENGRLDMVSQMVTLLSEGVWARFLIPAFVFFFQKLYPFAWVNDPGRRTAAAAGGSVLLRRDTLDRIGGFACLRDAIIDDCTLARAVKGPAGRGGRIWLGLTTASVSLRPYHGLGGVWRMVSRSAFTQLRYSTVLLGLTIIGMAILYWGPPVVALAAAVAGYPLALAAALAAWGLMAAAFWPTLRLYRQTPLFAPSLPLAGLLYSLMTLDSAIAYWQGRGAAWKGRTLADAGPARSKNA